EISVKTGNNARNGGKNSLNRLIRCVCGKKIGPDPRNFNQRVSLGRNDLLIRTFHKSVMDFISILSSIPFGSVFKYTLSI
ncbi:EAL domain-containing protein, partial [Klebsiella pneumoniae]